MRQKRNIALWCILITGLLIALACIGLILWEIVLLPVGNQQAADEIRTIAAGQLKTESDSSLEKEKPEDPEPAQTIDFTALRKVNSDIIGWIKIPNTAIDYPVLQSSPDDPEFYLYRNYKGSETKYGSIFADANAEIGVSQCMTLYGHHMNDGQMFAGLLQYDDLDFYKAAPTFFFTTYTDTTNCTWKIFSILKTNVDSSQGEPFAYVRTDFGGKEDFLNFLYQVKIRSIIDTGITVNENDQLLVLSTCSYEMENFRTVIVARKVRKGESEKVATGQATYAKSPLYPDGWYSNTNEQPTYPKTFAQAQKQNLTGWYDGINA